MVKKPKSLILEEALHRRLLHYVFSENYYFTSIGYEGELLFAERYPIQNHHLELYNINLNLDNIKFEIDRLIITGESIYAFDIKNYNNKYKNNGKSWLTKNTEITSPELKYNMIDNAMKRLLFSLNIPHNYSTYFPFINKQFYIDNSFNGLLTYNDLNKIFDRIHTEKPATEKEVLIKNYFNKAHRPLSFQDKRPDFDFRKIIIGLKCIKCNSSKVDMSYSKKKCICRSCLTVNTKSQMVLDNLFDLDIILGRPFSINEAHKWIGAKHRNLTNSILKKDFKMNDDGKYFYPYP